MKSFAFRVLGQGFKISLSKCKEKKIHTKLSFFFFLFFFKYNNLLRANLIGGYWKTEIELRLEKLSGMLLFEHVKFL